MSLLFVEYSDVFKMDAMPGRLESLTNSCADFEPTTREKRTHCTCISSNKRSRTNYTPKMRLLANNSTIFLAILAMLLLKPPGLADAAHLSEYDICLRGEYFEDYALKGGSKAGDYIKLGSVTDFTDCAELCCKHRQCKMALLLRTSCFRVDCYKGEPHRCQRISAKRSKFKPKLFIRGEVERPLKMAKSESGLNFMQNSSLINDTKLPELIRVKRRKASCHHYNGKVCKGHLSHAQFYYFTTQTPSEFDRKLAHSFQIAQAHLSQECKRFALFAMCASWYPKCLDPKHPKPTKICRRSCEQLQDEWCQREYDYDGDLAYVRNVLPDCDDLPDKEEDPNCVQLDDMTVENPEEIEHTTPATTVPVSTLAVKNSPDESSRVETSPPKSSVNLKKQPGSSESTEGSDENQNEKKSEISSLPEKLDATVLPTSSGLVSKPTVFAKHGSTAIMVSTVLKPSRSGVLKTTSMAVQKSNKPSPTHPTLVTVIAKSEAGTNLEEKENNKKVLQPTAVSTTTTKPPTKTEAAALQVSAGDNKVITLPENKVSLYASTWPKPAKDEKYKYQWFKLSAPKKSQGYMEGKDQSRLVLTQLDVAGVYQFKVEVSNENGNRKGAGFVNVTVKPVPRINHAPRAVIQPKEVTVKLPTNEAVLDGSKSSDDDKIVKYKWEEKKGPISTKGTLVSNGASTPLLQLKNLEAGEYTFRLTVTDSDGEEDHDDVTVTVLPEKDYPPVARAGKDVVLTLPHNSAVLYGNGSTDDKAGLKYEWTKSADSPSVGDMLGTTKPILKLSNLVVGDYTFVLKITDSAGQTSKSKVTVIVRPEKNEAPKAVAGSDKDLVFPDDATVLDARKSKDDSKIVKYKWEKVSGPAGMVLKGEEEPVLHISKLVEGNYIFKLTITDDKGLTDSDTVAVNVKKNQNQPPIAKAGPDVLVRLPSRSAQLDGSKSTDDQLIASYEWKRDGKSPAAGDVLNHSDNQAILQLTNLVEGDYSFVLTVTDNRGLFASDNVLLSVKEDTNSLYLVELYLKVDIYSFSEDDKKQLLRKLSVILNVDDKNVVLEQIRQAGYGSGIVLLFYVIDPVLASKMDGAEVANLLKQKIGFHGTLFEYKMLRVEPYICRNNCSNHGYCDRDSKLCICDSFWMQNFFKAGYGERISNCDWSVLYLSVIVFGLAMSFIGLTWAICFCCSRRSRMRRRGRGYYPLKSEDQDESKEEIMMISKGNGKYFAHSLTFTESEDSEEERTVFDKKRLGNGNGSINGSINGSVKMYKSHAM